MSAKLLARIVLLTLLPVLLYLTYSPAVRDSGQHPVAAFEFTPDRSGIEGRAEESDDTSLQSSSTSRVSTTGDAIAPSAFDNSLAGPMPDSSDTGLELSLEWIHAVEYFPADIAMDGLRSLFQHRNAGVRYAALEALADMKHPQRLGILAFALADPEVEIRILVLDALSSLAPGEVVPLIEAGLADPDITVRIAAIDALVDLETSRVMQSLIPMLFDYDAQVRRHAVAALGEVGGADADVYLQQSLYDSDVDTREIARAILFEMHLDTAQ